MVMTAPIVATMKEPIPTICVWIYGVVNIIFALNFNVIEKQEPYLEKTL